MRQDEAQFAAHSKDPRGVSRGRRRPDQRPQLSGMNSTSGKMLPTAKNSSPSPHTKRTRRRVRRRISSQPCDRVPGTSLTVFPAHAMRRSASFCSVDRDELDRQVAETLCIDVPDAGGDPHWLLSRLPEILRRCCRPRGASSSSDVAAPPRPPLRRRIRIRVSSQGPGGEAQTGAGSGSDSARSRGEVVLDVSGLRAAAEVQEEVTVRRSRAKCREATGRSARRPVSSSLTSLEDRRAGTRDEKRKDRGERREDATAELIRRVLEEMFGKSGEARGSDSFPADATFHLNSILTASAGPGDPTAASKLAPATQANIFSTSASAAAAAPAVSSGSTTSSSSSGGGGGGGGCSRSSRSCQTSPRLLAGAAAEAAAQTEPSAPETPRRILDTLTESNHLLREMAEFFRRAELGPWRDKPAGRWQEPAGGLGSPSGDAPGYRQGGPRSVGVDTARRRVDLDLFEAERSARRSGRAGGGSPPGSWDRPAGREDSPPLSSRSWGSPGVRLSQRGGGLPRHAFSSPPSPTRPPPSPEAAPARSESSHGAQDAATRGSSPPEGLRCSHRGDDIDSTDILLDYDPWKAIENDFKALLLK